MVNCAADYSENYHINDGVSYRSYYLKDHVKEDIACVFYDAIKFMQDARDQGGKVYVHCVQGISRSATICIAYLMLTQKFSFKDGEMYVKGRRACVNPNLRFITQLKWFYQRLYDPSFDCLSVNPRVFAISPHTDSDPSRVVCKLLMQNLFYRSHETYYLDPRGMFIV